MTVPAGDFVVAAPLPPRMALAVPLWTSKLVPDRTPEVPLILPLVKIGRASCRESVQISGVAPSTLKPLVDSTLLAPKESVTAFTAVVTVQRLALPRGM